MRWTFFLIILQLLPDKTQIFVATIDHPIFTSEDAPKPRLKNTSQSRDYFKRFRQLLWHPLSLGTDQDFLTVTNFFTAALKCHQHNIRSTNSFVDTHCITRKPFHQILLSIAFLSLTLNIRKKKMSTSKRDRID